MQMQGRKVGSSVKTLVAINQEAVHLEGCLGTAPQALHHRLQQRQLLGRQRRHRQRPRRAARLDYLRTPSTAPFLLLSSM